MSAYALQRRGTGDALHCVCIGAETHRAGKGDVGGGVPVAVGGPDEFQYVIGLALKPLEGQCRQPVVEDNRRHFGKMARTG